MSRSELYEAAFAEAAALRQEIERLSAKVSVNKAVVDIAREIIMHWDYEKPDCKVSVVIDADYISRLENAFDGIAFASGRQVHPASVESDKFTREEVQEAVKAAADSRQKSPSLEQKNRESEDSKREA